MLVVVHHGNVECALQTLLDVETFGCLDIFEVDASESGGNALHCLTELLWVFFVYLNVEDVYATIYLEEKSLAFHHWFAAHRSDVAKAEYCRSIGDDSYQVALVCIPIGIVWVLLNLQAWIGYPRRIGQREVCLCTISLRGLHFNLSRTAGLMIGQCRLFSNLHHFVSMF